MVAALATLNARLTGKVRRETLNGREYFVAPMTLIVPGVLNGSRGALYYPPEEIAFNCDAWNHAPITVYHPKGPSGEPASAHDPYVMERQGIGFLRNVSCNGKLKAEGWFDAERTQKVDRRVYNALDREQPIELSTGLFTDNEVAPVGSKCPRTGRQYDYVARNYRPDHLAVLPDQVGACSIADGCGVLVNANPEGHNQYTSGALAKTREARDASYTVGGAPGKAGMAIGRHVDSVSHTGGVFEEKKTLPISSKMHQTIAKMHDKVAEHHREYAADPEEPKAARHLSAAVKHEQAAIAHREAAKMTSNAFAGQQPRQLGGKFGGGGGGGIAHKPIHSAVASAVEDMEDEEEDGEGPNEPEADPQTEEAEEAEKQAVEELAARGMKGKRTKNMNPTVVYVSSLAGRHLRPGDRWERVTTNEGAVLYKITRNASPNQPRHAESGQYLHHGAGTGKGPTHGAAVEGYGETGEPDEEADPIDGEDEEIGQGDRPAMKKTQNSNPEGINQYTKGARAASDKAEASGKESDHAKAADEHEKAYHEHRKVGKEARDKGDVAGVKAAKAGMREHRDSFDYHATMAIPTSNNSPSPGQPVGGMKMKREEMIENLVGNCRCGDKDRQALNMMSDDLLTALNAKAEGSNADVTGPGGTVQAGGKGSKDEYAVSGNKFGKKDDDEDEDDSEMEFGPKRAKNAKGDAAKAKEAAQKETESAGDKWDDLPESAKKAAFAHMDETKNRRSNLSPEDEEVLNYGRIAYRRDKLALVRQLIANVQGDKERERIGGKFMQKPMAELRELVALLPNQAPSVRNGYTEQASYVGAADFRPITNRSGKDYDEDVLPIQRIDWAAERAAAK